MALYVAYLLKLIGKYERAILSRLVKLTRAARTSTSKYCSGGTGRRVARIPYYKEELR